MYVYLSLHTYIHTSAQIYIHTSAQIAEVCMYMGWLRWVGSLKWSVSFAEYSLFYRSLLQKRPIILRSLLIIATPYLCNCRGMYVYLCNLYVYPCNMYVYFCNMYVYLCNLSMEPHGTEAPVSILLHCHVITCHSFVYTPLLYTYIHMYVYLTRQWCT